MYEIVNQTENQSYSSTFILKDIFLKGNLSTKDVVIVIRNLLSPSTPTSEYLKQDYYRECNAVEFRVVEVSVKNKF